MSLAATLALADAARQHWDVVVIGAGPAGALAARETARRGLSVLLVERAHFPRWKVCGCCLNERALATLAEVGLGGLCQRAGAVPLAGICLATAGHEAWINWPGSVALSRERFDGQLVEEAIGAGAAFLPGTLVRPGGEQGHCRELHLHEGDRHGSVAARVVLAAGGLGGAFLADAGHARAQVTPHSRIGAGAVVEDAPRFYQSGRIFMACGREGYLGLVRLEDGRLDLAAAFDAGALKSGGPATAATRLLHEVDWPLPGRMVDLGWRGTPALTRRAARLAGDRLFVLGDAASYVEPFTGEGMAWALAGAVAVAELADRAGKHWSPALGREWAARYHAVVARRQLACRVAAGVLRHPRLARLVVGLLALAPGLARPVVRHLNGPRQRQQALVAQAKE